MKNDDPRYPQPSELSQEIAKMIRRGGTPVLELGGLELEKGLASNPARQTAGSQAGHEIAKMIGTSGREIFDDGSGERPARIPTQYQIVKAVTRRNISDICAAISANPPKNISPELKIPHALQKRLARIEKTKLGLKDLRLAIERAAMIPKYGSVLEALEKVIGELEVITGVR